MAIQFTVRQDRENNVWGVLDDQGNVLEDNGGFDEWVEEESELHTTPTFENPTELIQTYSGPFLFAEIVDYEKSGGEKISKIESLITDSMESNDVTFDDVFKDISHAYDNTVWWKYNEKDPDLSKSPDMWNEANPSDEAKEWIEAAIEHGAIYGRYKSLPSLSPINLERLFRRRIKRDQGFRVEDIVDDLQDLFPSADEEKALNIARTETGAILDTAKDLAHDAQMAEIEDEADSQKEVEEMEPKYKWVGPNDESTTKICEEVGRITNDKNGVSLGKLKDLLRREAQKSKSGTPSRADEFVPHYQCRRTMERV